VKTMLPSLFSHFDPRRGQTPSCTPINFPFVFRLPPSFICDDALTSSPTLPSPASPGQPPLLPWKRLSPIFMPQEAVRFSTLFFCLVDFFSYLTILRHSAKVETTVVRSSVSFSSLTIGDFFHGVHFLLAPQSEPSVWNFILIRAAFFSSKSLELGRLGYHTSFCPPFDGPPFSLFPHRSLFGSLFLELAPFPLGCPNVFCGPQV